jgi:hypothetical protein
MKYLRQLAGPIPVEPIVAELEAHPQLWNRYEMRTGYADSPHQVDDIWVRFRDFNDILIKGMALQDFVGTEHESRWYPAIDVLPSLKSLIFETMRYFEVERLGGVLITRIPPGGEVKWHTDSGWHAQHYSKLAVQLKSVLGQAFCFEDGQFECEPGTVYAFDNSVPHRVINPTDQERITLIMCVRTDQRKPPLWQ